MTDQTSADTVTFARSGEGAIVGALGDVRVAIFRHPGCVDVIVVDKGENAHAGSYASEAGFKKQLRNMVREGHDGSFAQKRMAWSPDALRIVECDWRIGKLVC